MGRRLTQAEKERRASIAKLRGNMRYVRAIPRKPLPKDRVLVHNHVVPQRVLGFHGFRAWTQTLDDTLEVCSCKWAGVDLKGLVHYRVKRAPGL